jgi:hypothetical protein
MLALSVVSLLEEALAVGKNQAGNVKRLEELFEPANFAKLTDVADLVAFLAFHPAADTAVTDYVRKGTLADDSGPRLLVLFTLDTQISVPVAVDGQSFGSWLEIQPATHPAYQMVRFLFNGRPEPPLPGLAFFQGLASESEAVYVPLHAAAEERDVRILLRTVFSIAGHAAANSDRLDDLCVGLRRQRIDYLRTGRTSVREWLLRGYRLTQEHRGEIVSAIGLFG